jgi:exodeoxyribonuclease V beta subunit
MKKFLALKASAGSGKTFSLVIRYISLLFMEAKPSEILALTFTNKASYEMQNRINQVLNNLENEPIYLEKISQECNISQDEILSKKSYILNRFLKSDISILTIDKFLNKILRSFCWYEGISNDFAIAPERKETIKEIFLNDLNDDEFFTLISLSFKESKNLDYFFEVFETIYEKEKESISYPKVSNIDVESKIMHHAYQIKDYIINSDASNSGKKAVDYNNINELLEKGKTWLAKESLAEYTYFKKVYIDTLDTHLVAIKELISVYFEQKESNLFESIFYFYDRYKSIKLALKKRKNELSFNDVTNFVYSLLKERVDNDFLYFRLDSTISHILVDEFQDTSVLQFEILKPLIDEITSGSSTKDLNRSFFYVGDPKQSIYRFRGGKRELFDYVLDKYKDYSLSVENLKTNYRTNRQIVEFVNRIFKPRISDFVDQEAHHLENAYIKVDSNEFAIDLLEPTLKRLFSIGVDESDIAILTFKNDDILKVQSLINERFDNVNVVTETSSKLINQPKIKAIINYINYLYYNEDIYKANFLSIIGMDPFAPIEIDKSQKSKSIPQIIIFLTQKYGLVDENIIKFLEISYNYKDIHQFVHEIELLDSAVVGKSANGIKVMTIHKSKGLEFENVIVLDALSKKSNQPKKIIFDYDNIRLNRVYHYFKGRENYDKEYEKAIKKENSLSVIDSINTLYVALTRAKESLAVLRNEKNSEFDILNIDNQEIGELVFKFTTPKEQQEITPYHIEQKPYGMQDDFLKKESLLEYKANDYESIEFGKAVHFMLENLKEFDISSIDSAYAITKNRYGYLIGTKLQLVKEIVQNCIQDDKFKELTCGKIYKEIPFYYKDSIGVIDALIEHDDKLIIIDYKTSSKSSANIYHKQLNLYKEAISNIYQKDTIAYLCFVGKETYIQQV